MNLEMFHRQNICWPNTFVVHIKQAFEEEEMSSGRSQSLMEDLVCGD